MDVTETSIVFNGGIYNYRELKHKYLPSSRLRTHSDTEVLLNLYRKFGPKCVVLLDGKGKHAIQHKGEILLARDPIGIKPLYCSTSADRKHFFFA